MPLLSIGLKINMEKYTNTIKSVEYFDTWQTGLKLIVLQEDLKVALDLFLWQHLIFIAFRVAFHLTM